MGNYGGNVTAAMTQGRLIYVDEPTAEDLDLTAFDEAAVTMVDALLGQFGTEGIYQPGVLNRDIEGIVRYVQDDSAPGAVPRLRAPRLHLKVPNTAVNGITADEFAANQTVSIAPREGSDTRTFQLTRIVKQSGAWVTYELH